MPSVPTPPVAPRRNQPRSYHGDTFLDPYAWMRDKASEEFTQLLAAENDYAAAMTAHQEQLRADIYNDIAVRTKQTDLSVPEFVSHPGLGTYWYYARTQEGNDYPTLHRCPAVDRDHLPAVDAEPGVGEELLLDLQALSRDEDFLALGAFAVSPNGCLLAYSLDTSGDERYELRFRDLLTHEDLDEEITDISAGGTWLDDDRFCYLRVDDTWRPHELWLHQVGATSDELLYTEPDERFWLSVDSSRDDRFMIVSVGSKSTSQVWLVDPRQTPLELRSVAERRDGIEYDVEVATDRLFIVHNDGAADFALAQAPLDATSAQQWRTVWPGEPGVRLLGVSAYDRALVISERRDGLQQVALRPRDASGDVADAVSIEFDEPLYTVDADDGDEANTDRIRLHYQSMVTPPQVLEYHLSDGHRTVLRSKPVLDHPTWGSYRPSDYQQRREWATAADGTRIPISVVYRADTSIDGTAGGLLYGYGAYEISLSPTFSIARLSLLDRGYVYAIAHVRGGGELGREWYEQGRLAAKQNTFTDFVACAARLVELGYVAPDRLAIEGGSAGGLLIGAALNLAPELFRAAHAAVPFVDALTTVLDPDLPLTVTEWEEWGDPLHDRQAYARMRRYSPYENVHQGRYPAVLVTTSLNDTRVEVTEPAKWVAELRYTTGSDRPVLMRTELVAGHAGASGRYQGWRDAAFELAWLIDQTGSL